MNEPMILEIGQRLGWTLVHSVWQFALIALSLAIGLRLLRGCSSHLRYGFMLTALFAMAVASSVTFFAVDAVAVTAESDQNVGESLRESQIVGQTSNDRLSETELRANADYMGRQRSEEARAVDTPNGFRRSASAAASPRIIENMLIEVATTTQSLASRMA